MRRSFVFYGPKGLFFFVHRNEQGGSLRGIIVKCIMNEKNFVQIGVR